MSLLLSPHVSSEHADKVSPGALFKSMPASFPDDVEVKQASAPAETEMTMEQKAERERRMSLPRLQRPR